MTVVTFELLELDIPAQTFCPTTNTVSLFAHVFQLFSSSHLKLHPHQLVSGAKHLLTPTLLCGQEEHKIHQPLLPSGLTLAGTTPLHGVCLLCPHTHMVATRQSGSVTCAVGVILCKSTSEFRPVGINLLS